VSDDGSEALVQGHHAARELIVLPGPSLTFSATVVLPSGIGVGLQAISKHAAGDAWDSSNTEIITEP
jgi:hypothetical protein